MRKIIEEGMGKVGKDYVNALQYLKNLGITMALVAEMQTALADNNLTMNLDEMKPMTIRVGDTSEDLWLPRILCDLHSFQFENVTTNESQGEAQGEAGAMNRRLRNFDHDILRRTPNWLCPPWQVDNTIVKEAVDTVNTLLYRGKQLKHPTIVISRARRDKVEFDRSYDGKKGANLLLGPWDIDLTRRNFLNTISEEVITMPPTMPPAQNEQLPSTPQRKKRTLNEIYRKSPGQDDNSTPGTGSRKSSRKTNPPFRYTEV
jgi:hypothetical protein